MLSATYSVGATAGGSTTTGGSATTTASTTGGYGQPTRAIDSAAGSARPPPPKLTAYANTSIVPGIAPRPDDGQVEKPWYMRWQTWAIAGGVVVGVTGIVILAR